MKIINYYEKQKQVSWKRISFHLASTITFLIAASAMAQPRPDIVWSTNAHSHNVESLSFSSDSCLLASGGHDFYVKLWSLTNFSLVRTFVTAYDGGYQGGVTAVAISPDSQLIGAGDDNEYNYGWQISDGTRLWYGGVGIVKSVAFSPDSALFATGRSMPGKITIRDIKAGELLPFPEIENGINAVRFSPDGKYLVSGYYNRPYIASLWSMSDYSLVRDFIGHSFIVTALDISPDGTLLATTSWDGTTRLWRMADGTNVCILDGGGEKESVKFSPDGKLLVQSCSKGDINFWRVSDGKLLLTYSNLTAGAIAVSPDGKYFAYGGWSNGMGTIFLARMPVFITDVGRTNQHLRLEWHGGSGIYQVQQTTTVTSGVWIDIGTATTGTSTNISINPTNTYFRIKYLTNAI